MMAKAILYTFFLGIMLGSAGCSSNDSIQEAADQSVQQFEQAGVKGMENDALFVAETASVLMLQEQLAQAASEKAVSPEVKGLSQQMQQAHLQMLEELRQLASTADFVLPSTLGNAQQNSYQDINDKTGIAFDLAYIKEMVEQHEKLLARYKDMAANGKVMEVKQYASRQVPLIEQHLASSERLAESIDNI
ncbi:DUF4142 domain-containing protein [Pontibacter arcticus]|uniref:DUF4142 domain-containing protein n=2 Tax=Pontibacter arcticus TaxID=2080288 RepID=A0A364RJM3_9BACT|nr:DUF4142 domain-containing protein [Pontibacter arcticus]